MKTSKPAAPKSVTPKSVPPKVEPEIRILKVATCPSLSGKSKLTYHVGCTPESDIQLRVYANNGGGSFNDEWIALSAIRETLKKSSQITSFSLRSLYAGKSTNSPGFLLALLKAEGLVQIKGEKERVYVAIDSEKFRAEVKALMASSVDIKIPQKAKPPKGKAVKADGKGQDIEPQHEQDAGKAPEKPSKPEAKTAKVEPKPTAPSKKAASKATPKKNSPR